MHGSCDSKALFEFAQARLNICKVFFFLPRNSNLKVWGPTMDRWRSNIQERSYRVIVKKRQRDSTSCTCDPLLGFFTEFPKPIYHVVHVAFWIEVLYFSSLILSILSDFSKCEHWFLNRLCRQPCTNIIMVCFVIFAIPIPSPGKCQENSQIP